MGIIDKLSFERKGALGCSDSDYCVQRATCCGTHFVEDVELSELYFDPTDLTRRVSLWRASSDARSLPCPSCGASEWDMEEVEELAAVPEPWRWACPAR